MEITEHHPIFRCEHDKVVSAQENSVHWHVQHPMEIADLYYPFTYLISDDCIVFLDHVQVTLASLDESEGQYIWLDSRIKFEGSLYKIKMQHDHAASKLLFL